MARLALLLVLAGCISTVTTPPPDAGEVLAAVNAMPECDVVRQGVVIVWHSEPITCGETASMGCAYPYDKPPRVDVVNQGSAWNGPVISGHEVSTLAHELCHVCGYLDEEEADSCASRALMISKTPPDFPWEGFRPGPDGKPVSGRWTLTGTMNEPRSQHALTLLADGRVLAAGGCRRYSDEHMGCAALATAEIFDPVTGIWTPTGSMNEARRNYGAVLLRDGRVLVAGGCDSYQFSCMATAEIYDPAEGTWIPTATMAMPRSTREDAHALVLLQDGRALFAGGFDWDGGWTGSFAAVAEVYDPALDTWTPTGPMNWPRGPTSAVLLPCGDVLAVGGLGGWGSNYQDALLGTPTAERYHPESNTWTATTPLGRAVMGNTLTLLPTGDVLLTNGFSESCATLGGGHLPPPCPSALGGYDLGAEQAEADIYRPATEEWRQAPPMRFPRLIQSATRLPSGRVLVVGGNWIRCEGSGDSRRCSPYMAPQGEIYDPWLDTWTLTPAMPHYVLGAGAAVLLQSGEALFAGGVTHGPFLLYESTIGAAELFSEMTPSLLGARAGPTP